MNTHTIENFHLDVSSGYTSLVSDIEYKTKKEPIREANLFGQYGLKVYRLCHQKDTGILDKFRSRMVSSSDIAKIAGISRYATPKDTLLYKLGFHKKEQTIPSIVGIETEKIAAHLYRFYPKGEGIRHKEMFIHNYTNNLVVNNIEKEEYIYVIEIVINFRESLYVMVSPDYIDTDLMAPVEIKTINEFSFTKYDKEKDNYDYIFQSLFQQMIYGSQVGYLFYMISNYDISKKAVTFSTYENDIYHLIHVIREFYKVLYYCKDNHLSFQDVVRSFYIDPDTDIEEIEAYKKWISKLKINENTAETEQEINSMEENTAVNDIIQKYHEMSLQKNELEKECKRIKNTLRQMYIDKKVVKTDIAVINLHPFRIRIR